MKSLYESIMQSREPSFKIGESILNKSGVGKIYLIQKWLDEHGIKKYTINNKGEIDVDGNVYLTNKGLTEFPPFIQFGTVNGDFGCSHNKLVSLSGCPRVVKRNIYCSHNNLKTLKGAPEKVEGSFDCPDNELTTLKGAPREIGVDFCCFRNKLTSLKGAPAKVGGDFMCSFNDLTSLIGAPKKVGRNFYCQKNDGTYFSKDDVLEVSRVEGRVFV